MSAKKDTELLLTYISDWHKILEARAAIFYSEEEDAKIYDAVLRIQKKYKIKPKSKI